MDPAQAVWRPADSLASDIVSARQSARHDAIVEEAIARVLAAERAARESIAQAHADASAIAEAAAERARTILARTERRMQRVRAAYDAATQAQLAEISAAATTVVRREETTPADRACLALAVAALAEQLSGGKR